MNVDDKENVAPTKNIHPEGVGDRGGTLRRISYLRAPARSSGNPADLSVTDGAAEPVTSIPLLHNDATLGAVHGLARLHKSLRDNKYVGHKTLSLKKKEKAA